MIGLETLSNSLQRKRVQRLAHLYHPMIEKMFRKGWERILMLNRKLNRKKIRKAQRAVEESEAKIAKLEARKSELDALLLKPENASDMELVTEYTNLQRELDEENDNWMIFSEQLEQLNK